jgi:hypothetical protein
MKEVPPQKKDHISESHTIVKPCSLQFHVTIRNISQLGEYSGNIFWLLNGFISY